MRLRRPRILVVGAGDIGLRLIRLIQARHPGRIRVFGTTRRAEQAQAIRAAGGIPLPVDLDRFKEVKRLRGLAAWLVHLAPPPAAGRSDPRSRHLVAQLAQSQCPFPQRWVYASTSGVYGDCGGALIDETRPVKPRNARAVRRVAGEKIMRQAARSTWSGLKRLAILRVPGIYDSQDRLPVERLLKGLPALDPAEDVYTNHIHADDLARIVWHGIFKASGGRLIHSSDSGHMKMGEYFDAVAQALSLPKPPRMPREGISAHLSEAMMSFMTESRRLDNRRLLEQWRVRLLYPSVAIALEKRSVA
jgi:nucleoside-diphosphate-sugar epimerase